MCRDPRVSTERLCSLMEGRKLLRLLKIQQKSRSADMDSDWVTVGVVVSKTDPKVSSKVRNVSSYFRYFFVVFLVWLLYAFYHASVLLSTVASTVLTIHLSVTLWYKFNHNTTYDDVLYTTQLFLYFSVWSPGILCRRGKTREGERN